MDIGWSVFASPDFLTRHGTPKRLTDLARYPWVAPEASLFHLPAAAWIRQHIPEDNIVIRGSTLNTLSRMAEAGLGLAVLPDDQVKPSLERIMDFTPGAGGGFWLLTHPDLRHTGRVKALMEFLIEAFRGEPRLRRGV